MNIKELSGFALRLLVLMKALHNSCNIGTCDFPEMYACCKPKIIAARTNPNIFLNLLRIDFVLAIWERPLHNLYI